MAKEKKASRLFILYEILDNGFDAAVQGYLSAKKGYTMYRMNGLEMKEFKAECDNFSKVGQQIAKIVLEDSDVSWKQRHHNFDDWMKENKQLFQDGFLK